MLCPYCRIDTDNDSYFCDQCGKEVLICPKCGSVGRGNKCIHDGSTLVTARERAGVSDGGMSDGARSSPDRAAELHLINRELALDLRITGDEIIGRQTGRFIDVFEQHRRVSGQHCQIRFDRKQGWSVADLGSTHGTKLNEVSLQPKKPQPLTDRSLLLIANIEFYVEIRNSGARADASSE